jgi:O-succinylbenzoic acid--CoA ligase
MPTLRRLSDADPAALTAALEAVWAAGDAAMVLPDDAPAAAIPAGVSAALAGRLRLPEGAALVVATSGSTGAPRAVVLDHGALAAATTASQARHGSAPGERWALALPVRHVAGLMVLLRARALGTAPVVVDDPGDPAALAAAAREAQHIALVPTQLARTLDAGVDLTALRTVLVGGGPAAPGLVERARAAGIRVVTSYGMTETCGGCVYDGLPLDGTEIALGTDGRIRLRGPTLARGELDADAPGGLRPLTDADGWFVTSDVGRMVDGHPDGRLEVLGRVDDLIISGGVNVDPVAVADAVRTHPGVADAVVVGVAHPTWGRVVRAVIATRADATAPDLAALRAHVAERLGGTHAPWESLVVPRIPRDGMGKVSGADRADLAARPATEVYSPA